MRDQVKRVVCGIGLFVMCVSATGCAVHLHKRLPGDMERLSEMNEQLERERLLRADEQERMAVEREQLDQTLENLRRALERELAGDKDVKVDMQKRGLVVTFVAEVLFDSGKATLRQEALGSLDAVARVVTKIAPDRRIAIEGHTDNVPIKHSGWKSNWELSTARATSVLHYLVDEKGIPPQLVHASGYGEFRPVADNEAKEGRQKNRRVEIVILPDDLTRVRAGEEGSVVPEKKSAGDKYIK